MLLSIFVFLWETEGGSYLFEDDPTPSYRSRHHIFLLIIETTQNVRSTFSLLQTVYTKWCVIRFWFPLWIQMTDNFSVVLICQCCQLFLDLRCFVVYQFCTFYCKSWQDWHYCSPDRQMVLLRSFINLETSEASRSCRFVRMIHIINTYVMIFL